MAQQATPCTPTGDFEAKLFQQQKPNTYSGRFNSPDLRFRVGKCIQEQGGGILMVKSTGKTTPSKHEGAAL